MKAEQSTSQTHFTQWPMRLSLPVIGADFGFSSLIGVIFGDYPAMKATRLDSIKALKAE